MPRQFGFVSDADAAARAAFHEERLSRQRLAMFAVVEGSSSSSSSTSSSLPRNVFIEFFAFARFIREGLSATLSFNAPGTPCWNDAVVDELLALTRENMRSLYDGAGAAVSSWSWDDAAKREELCDKDARYVIARAGQGQLLGFVHFRFVLEEPATDALYVYELQLAASAQRKGLGRHLMIVCELIARKQGMHW